MVLTRQYTIPLRREWLKVPKYKRAKRAVAEIKVFLERHMRADSKDVKIGRWLNELVWERGIKNPPSKVRVNASKDDKGIVKVELIELSERAKKIQLKEDTRVKVIEDKKKAEEAAKKAQEEAAKKAEEDRKKAEEAAKTKAEKEVDKEKKAIEEKVKHETIPPKEKNPGAGKDTKPAKHQHPVRQALKK